MSDKQFMIGVFVFFIVIGCIAGVIVSRNNNSAKPIAHPGAIAVTNNGAQAVYTRNNPGARVAGPHALRATRPLPAYLNPSGDKSPLILNDPDAPVPGGK